MTAQNIELSINEEYLDLIPRPSKEERQALKESIMVDGLHTPLIINPDGVVLDGHTRYEICQELSIKPPFVIKDFETKEQEKEFVVTSNLIRRQLNPYQRVELIYNLYKQIKAQNLKRMGFPKKKGKDGKFTSEPADDKPKPLPIGHTSQVIGKKIGISKASVERGIFVIEHAEESLKSLVRQGKISLAEGHRSIRMKLKISGTFKSKHGSKSITEYKHCPRCEGIVELAENCHAHTRLCCKTCNWGR